MGTNLGGFVSSSRRFEHEKARMPRKKMRGEENACFVHVDRHYFEAYLHWWEFDMRSLTRAMVLMVALIFAGAAAAQPRPGGGGGGGGGGPAAPSAPGGLIHQFNAEQIAQIFNAAGFPSQVADDKINDKKTIRIVVTHFWGNDNTFGGAFPEACSQDNPNVCQAMQIFVNLGKTGVDSKWVNAYNATYLYVRAYQYDDGSLVFVFDFPLVPGVTPDFIKTAVTVFKAAVDASADFKP